MKSHGTNLIAKINADLNEVERVRSLIRKGEGLTIEFKESGRALSKSVYQSVCAFLNRNGGNILLGVADDGRITGIDQGNISRIKREIASTLNNREKISPPPYLALNEIDMGGVTILQVFVPESSQVHRCAGRIFDRSEDGDIDITGNTRSVAELYIRKQNSYSENRIYPHAELADLREDLIARVRKIAGIQRKDHPWMRMDDMELLKSAQLHQVNLETGKNGITLAGILLLGKDESILSAVPHHRTDLILRIKNIDRYDDRDVVHTNLIDSYDRIMAFIAKHLPDPFHLERDTRVSLRELIFREIASNILIHREYSNPFPAKLIIGKDDVRTENSNKSHGFGLIDPKSFSPFPKNPVIARFFREIGRADELGSGVRNLTKYGEAYGGRMPELMEGDIFRTIVYLPTADKKDVTTEVTMEVTTEVTMEVLFLSAFHGEMSRRELQARLGLKNAEHFRQKYLAPALESGLIEMTIPDKPKSRLQQYRLTEKGGEELEKMRKTHPFWR